MKGKNFSCNNTGKRKKSDFYETPFSMTQQLVETGEFDPLKVTLEPACGNGAILKILRKNQFLFAFGYDKEVDFLKETGKFSQIITNPPFSLAFEFIKQAKKVSTEKFAMLLPLSYLHGKKRLDEIFSDREYPLSKVYVFCRYPMLGEDLREDGKYNTGMMVYAWYIWEKDYQQEPMIRWLDNQSFVLSSKET